MTPTMTSKNGNKDKHQRRGQSFLLALLFLSTGNISPVQCFTLTPPQTSLQRTTLELRMGLLDSLSSFLTQRDGDFVKLEGSEAAFGPGPVVLLYGIPSGIDDGEIQDMLSDGAPKAFRKGVTLCRIPSNDSVDGSTEMDALLDSTVGEAITSIVAEKDSVATAAVAVNEPVEVAKCPVLYFSGFENPEMMATYNILGKEIYEETQGFATPACAKVVPNAMDKPLRQVLEEIAGDHREAMGAE